MRTFLSQKAVQVIIAIMRTFVMLRRYALTYEELAQKIEELEAKYATQKALSNSNSETFKSN
ncbi:MAG: hypothetical protein EPO28_05835 [Saprospiraceae bacterium]|nr:MAG: hypothetical protein EPO28_05835 [Saprospiraceae bacterium]